MSALTPEERAAYLHSNLDTSDCGVIAIQALTGLPYHEAEGLARRYGYVPGEGTPRGGIDKALQEHGMEVTAVFVDMLRDTPATFALKHEYGTYLLYTDKHVMAIIEGDLMNARGCWGKPLEAARRVKHR